MISRRCASTRTSLSASTCCLMIAAAMTVLPDPVGATSMMRRLPAARSRLKRGNGFTLIWAQARSCRTAARTWIGKPGTIGAAYGRLDGPQAIVFDQTIAVAGIDQPIDDLIAIEFATGDKLKQTKCRAV